MWESNVDIGQMFLVGFRGNRVGNDAWIVRAVRDYRLGGVIYFDRNVDGSVQNFRNPEELKELIASLNRASDIQLFHAVDQEGGKVCRLRGNNGFDDYPGPTQTCSEGSEKTAEVSERIAKVLKNVGLNLNFAPVVDLDVNPHNPVIGRFGRSYGSKPEEVARHAASFVKGHHRHGIACCLKHFPGHGSSGKDSHLGFVDITDSWTSIELEPYRRLIADGFEDGIMTGHLVHRGLDGEGLPATLSGAMIRGILRTEMKFNGVVFSDDLQMRAITNGWDIRKAVQLSVIAGVDVLVIGNNLENWETVVREGVAAIEELLSQKIVSTERILCSIQKINRLKRKIKGDCQW